MKMQMKGSDCEGIVKYIKDNGELYKKRFLRMYEGMASNTYASAEEGRTK